jgi:hypothetical protein
MLPLHFWKKRICKFVDNPAAVIPFIKKTFYYNFIADRYIKQYDDIVFMGYKETIDDIVDNNKSIVRFGDELINMLQGVGLYYDDWHQKYDKKLARRLKEVLRCKDERLLIGLHWQFFTKTKKRLEEDNIPHQIWTNSKVYLREYLDEGRVYGSALCFQPKFNPDLDFDKIVDYFKTKHIVIVTKNTHRFNGVKLGKTTDFIECPENDVWSEYDNLFSEAMKLPPQRGYDNKDVLFLVSLSSAAKVFVLDLLKEDYQGWDTGQFFDLALSYIYNKES